MAPLHDDPDCFAHDPERTAKATEARRIGGLRRREEGAIAVAYDLPGLDTVACTAGSGTPLDARLGGPEA
jgi:hypothetical protein